MLFNLQISMNENKNIHRNSLFKLYIKIKWQNIYSNKKHILHDLYTDFGLYFPEKTIYYVHIKSV